MQVGQTRDARLEYDRQIAELTRRGSTAADIAKQLGLNPRTITRARRRMGVAQPAVPRFSQDEVRRAEAMLDDGCSFREVARTLGRAHDTIMLKFPGRGWTSRQVAEYAAWSRTTRATLCHHQ